MAGTPSGLDRDRSLAWVERVATYFAQQDGLPPITGRILGWLMICDPPEQSAGEIARAVGASRASLTTNMRVLTASGFVQTLTRPGERTSYYRIADDAWAEVTRRKLNGLTAFLDITRDGLEMLEPNAPQASRVRAAHDLFAWLASEVDPLWRRWDSHRSTGE